MRNLILVRKFLGEKYGLPIMISGLPSMIGFQIDSPNWLKYKTFITQEMLKSGYLASNVVYVCTEHNENIVNDYFQILELIFKKISDCQSGLNIDSLLDGPVCHSGFTRLN